MEKDLTTDYDGKPFSNLGSPNLSQNTMTLIRVLMPICKEQKHQTLGCIPRFKTSAGLEPDISSASTVANCNE